MKRRSRCPAPRRARGFTIIELMSTLAIVAIVAAMAAPAYKSVVDTGRLKGHNAALQESLMTARSEAIKRQARVVVCKSADQASCTTAGNWQQGWIVFVDSNDSATVDAGEPILLKVPALAGSFILKGTNNVVSYVSFTSSGAAKESASQVFQSGVFTLCQPSGGDARQIELFVTGRLSLRHDAVSTCTP